MREHNRFVRGLTSWVGFKQTGVTYVRPPRELGETSYPLRKMIRLALDAITGFSFFPLQVAVYLSLILAFISIASIPVVVVLRLMTDQVFLEGQATTLSVLLLLTAFQLMFFFILGQYVARIYDETRGRPLYVVADTYGIPEKPPSPEE
jgi:dolichol-phosphate mannosyltransferase